VAGTPICDAEVALSSGVGVCPAAEAFEYPSPLAAADRALYASKGAGRDCVRVAGTMLHSPASLAA